MTKAPIEEIQFTAFVNGPTENAVALGAMLRALADEPLLVPTHGGTNERERSPFEVEPLASAAAAKEADALVWRTRRPKYWGSIGASPLPLARVLLHVEGIDAEDVEQVCEALVRVAERLQPAYAAMHFKWKDATQEQKDAFTGMSAKDLHVCKAGPPGIFAWTWFGPELTAALGLGPLLRAGARPLAGGGVSLPLVAKPWAAPFEELRARQLEVDGELRKVGLFGDYTQLPPEPGPAWIPRLPEVDD